MTDTTAALSLAAGLIAAADRIWLGTHLDPDGDAIGSVLGLFHILAARGKHVTAACQDPPPREVAFLPGTGRMSGDGPGRHDLAIALDAADAGRLGRLYTPASWGRQTTVVIDHHVSNPGFGDVNVIDHTAAATAEVVLAVADALGADVPRDAATCLLAGIVTDTLGFRTSNTTARSLEAAVRLMGAGARLAEINQHVFFTQPLAALRLTGRVIDRIQTDGSFAITWLTQEDLGDFGIDVSETQDITRQLATAAEPLAIALVRERPDGTFDVSLRSKPGVDVVGAATALGGGGHPQAAGARIPGPLVAAVGAVRGALAEHASGASMTRASG